MTVGAWGRLGAAQHRVQAPASRQAVAALVQTTRPGLAHGMGRSYGDAGLNPDGTLWLMRGLDRFIDFDPATGRLVCEAGVLLHDIQQWAVPRGWMLPVTPGTQWVTVGGAIANDVHGKNHHGLGSFGDHVLQLTLQRTDGRQIVCGPDQARPWFEATLGGVGLTGVVTQATLQLRRVPGPWLQTETVAYRGLDEFFALSEGSADWEYTVSWIDCLSGSAFRGLFMRGNHVDQPGRPMPPRRPLAMPFVPPVSLVNAVSLRAFNTLYYHQGRRKQGQRIEGYQPFFYPLDHIHDWNRMYGPQGFYQYQCVVDEGPPGRAAIAALLQAIARSGQGSFLAVLKTFGQRSSRGMLGFPRPGVTLALDFPNRGAATLQLFERLDAIVAEAGGRIYLAKDARQPRSLFQSGYPRLTEFLPYRDPGITSALARRLID